MCSVHTSVKGNVYICININMGYAVCTTQLKLIFFHFIFEQIKGICQLYKSLDCITKFLPMPWTQQIYYVSPSLRATPIVEGSAYTSSVLQTFLVSFLMCVAKIFRRSPQSNLICTDFEENHNFLFPLETKAKPLPHCHIFSDFHSEVKRHSQNIQVSFIQQFS